jgi:uncharacterized protein (DUF302 family)
MSQMSYERRSTFGFDETVTAVLESARGAGWVVLATHDMQQRFVSKNIEWHQGLTIVEICKAAYAAPMVAASSEVALHLPCPIVIRQLPEGQVYVSVLRPEYVAGLFEEIDFGQGPLAAEDEVRAIVDHATE